MHEKRQLLKWYVPLLALLVIRVAAFSIQPLAVTKANSVDGQNFDPGPLKPLGRSNLPETPETYPDNRPSTNTCQLALIKNGGGNAHLGSALAWKDPFLRKELVKYNLKCTDTRPLICVLIPNNMPHIAKAAERANLDLTNIRNTSPQLYEKLVGQYFLKCGPIVNQGVNRGGAFDSGRGIVVR
jgi:hypothetical protein